MKQANPWQWAGAYAIYAVVMMAVAESDKYAEIGASLAWLVLFGVAVTSWNQIVGNLNSITGLKLAGTQ